MTILFGNAKYSFQDELSSRPERTRISCHAALDKAACAPFCNGKAHEVHQRHQVPQEIRGSVVEGPAVFLLLTMMVTNSGLTHRHLVFAWEQSIDEQQNTSDH